MQNHTFIWINHKINKMVFIQIKNSILILISFHYIWNEGIWMGKIKEIVFT